MEAGEGAPMAPHSLCTIALHCSGWIQRLGSGTTGPGTHQLLQTISKQSEASSAVPAGMRMHAAWTVPGRCVRAYASPSSSPQS